MRKKNSLLRVVVIFSLLAGCLNGYSEGSYAEPFVELTPTVGLGSNSQAGIQLLGGSTWKVADQVSLGFGAGLASSFKFDSAPNVPVFFRSKIDLGKSDIVPFLLFDAGYSFNVEHIDYSVIMISPTLGVRTHGFYLGIGYIAGISTKGCCSVGHQLAFRLGYQFGSNRATPNLIKNSTCKVEVGAAYGNGKHRISYDFANGLGTEAFARVIWMLKPSSRFEIGIGSGVDVFLPSFGEGEDKRGQQLVSVPVFVRPQVNISPSESKIKPYVACDLGYSIDDNKDEGFSGLMLEPMVGVSFNKISLAAGYRVSRFHYENIKEDSSCGVSGISLRVGYEF